MILAVILFLAASAGDVKGARILAVFPITAKSHHILFDAVLRTLAAAGHEVVLYSGFPAREQVPNLTHIQLSNIEPLEKTMNKDVLIDMLNLSPIGITSRLWEKMATITATLGTDRDFLKLINSNETFDLVLLEAFFAQEQLFALGHKFNAPVISIQPFGAFCLVSRALGNPLSLVYIPDFAFSYSDHMSFQERALNAYSVLSTLFKYYAFFIPEQDRVMRETFKDPDLPPLQDLMLDRLAMVFSNAHPAVHFAQPYSPNLQPIGGIHLTKQRKPLPPDMKKFLDGSTEGVIYFSVGSIVPDQVLDEDYFNNFIAAFSHLPQRVLWKTNKDIKNLPNNILTTKWVPQQDVLAHPNVRVFMTHGGLFSQHEAIQAGVPVICTPYFGDQPLNAKFYEEKGVGVVLPFQTLSEETILAALNKVLGDPKYKDNMARMSRIYRDRPVSPADSLLFWVEYVIRHHGAPHLRPVSATMPVYQLYLLDVMGAVVGALLLISYVLYVIVKQLIGIVPMKKRSKTNDGKIKTKKEN